MKALVIHDRPEVAQEIFDLLVSLGALPEQIVVAEDGVGARKALQTDLFDLAIVDLTIPHLKGKSNSTYSVAEDLLNELFGTDGLNTPGDIIGITKDVGALENIDSQIGPHLMAVVGEDNNKVWKKQLADRISYIKKAANSRQRSANRHFDYDLAIITALDEEFAPYKDIFELTDHPHCHRAKTFLFQDRNGHMRRGVATSVGEAGQAPTAAISQAIMAQFRPSLFLMTGFCGGFSDKTVFGDVLIAESVVNWDCGKWKGNADEAVFFPRTDPLSIKGTPIHDVIRDMMQSKVEQESEIVEHAKTLSGGDIKNLNLRPGRVASGSAVVAHSSIISKIQTLNDTILGVDMEAYGLYYSAKFSLVVRPNVLAVKSVADYCDGTKSDKYHAACSYISAKIAEEIVFRRWHF